MKMQQTADDLDMQTNRNLVIAEEQILELKKVLYKQNEFLETLRDYIKEFSSFENEKQQKFLNHILLLLRHEIEKQKERNLFFDWLGLSNSTVISNLTSLYPDLSKGDIELIKLIRIGMDTKEIAALKNVEPNTIKTAKYRLKKRLSIVSEDSLSKYILSL
jgi:DNA-binding CsgD family transcriptional regulator